MVRLRSPLTLDECQLVRTWRNEAEIVKLTRTGPKTEADQAAFYRDVICNPLAPHRYYAIEHDDRFVGMGGLTHLDREAGQGEISIILDAAFRGLGIGKEAVDQLLHEAFVTLRLDAVVGECFSDGNLRFWTHRILERPASVRWRWERPIRLDRNT